MHKFFADMRFIVLMGLLVLFSATGKVQYLRSDPCCKHNPWLRDSVVRDDISPSTLIIYYSGTNKRVLRAAKKIGAEVIYTYHSFNAVAVRKPETWSLEYTKHYFESLKGVLQVSYDRVYHLD